MCSCNSVDEMRRGCICKRQVEENLVEFIRMEQIRKVTLDARMQIRYARKKFLNKLGLRARTILTELVKTQAEGQKMGVKLIYYKYLHSYQWGPSERGCGFRGKTWLARGNLKYNLTDPGSTWLGKSWIRVRIQAASSNVMRPRARAKKGWLRQD